MFSSKHRRMLRALQAGCLLSAASLFSAQVSALQCDYNVTNDWDSGFIATIKVTNNEANAISGWNVGWSNGSGTRITNAWGGVFTPGDVNSAENELWNGSLLPSKSAYIGIQGAGENSAGTIVTCQAKGGTDTRPDNANSPNEPNAPDSPPTEDAAKSIDLQAVASNNSVTLTWSLTGITPRTQEIMRDTDPNPSGRGRIGSTSSGTEFVDNKVTPGTTYYYWIKAMEADRTVTNSSAVSATVPTVNPEPPVPTQTPAPIATPAPTETPVPTEPPAPTAAPAPTEPPGEGIGAVDFSKKMGVGWNAGNSLEAIGGETAWGNPLLTQALFDAVKAAGFDTVRLPVAWSVFTDSDNFVIDSNWMTRVTEVVDYALNAGLYVIVNIHWDNGWMQPTYGQQDYVNHRLSIMWKQIATNFRNYDHRLLFAGTNEVMVDGDYGTPTEEYYTVQNSFNQTFVTTVRDTGGNNANRYLVVQGFNTNIDHTVNFAVVPEDTVADRLMMEVHYYDPYNFTLNTKSNITQWGSIATDANAVEDWANESWADAQFQKMKSNFVDKGIAVILGEYGVASRMTISDHEPYRVYWNEYISHSAIEHSLVPIYWDSGGNGVDGSTGIFNRTTGSQLYPDIIKAIVGAVK